MEEIQGKASVKELRPEVHFTVTLIIEIQSSNTIRKSTMEIKHCQKKSL